MKLWALVCCFFAEIDDLSFGNGNLFLGFGVEVLLPRGIRSVREVLSRVIKNWSEGLIIIIIIK